MEISKRNEVVSSNVPSPISKAGSQEAFPFPNAGPSPLSALDATYARENEIVDTSAQTDES
ncbi:hypothetical protein CVT25_015723 [Psilocybe cyanescens]|uniref:Uncharacterized protein n=1 Tax=Psilocybe cyanescens TaxID=93625 RepID=A0A409X1N4_PSICY|nr:hypothetical protein CVT25_015723 [Psilocybe cyanescens]